MNASRLSGRDRAKVSAALLEIRAGGHDPETVTKLAGTLIGMGTPPRKAYDTAFNRFTEAVPAFRAELQRIGQFIDAADNQTLSRYNVAMDAYIATGDKRHIDAIGPLVQHHAAAMAERSGDAGFADWLPDAAPQPERSERPGHGPTGYSPQDAAAPPAAPLSPPAVPNRPGHSYTGYSPAAARAQTAPPATE